MSEGTRTAFESTQWLGTITVEVEAACDGNAAQLAEDVYTVAVRALEERGADVHGGCFARGSRVGLHGRTG